MPTDGFPALSTDRLVIREMRAEDAPVLAGYRNDPETASQQDWNLPFTADDAARFVAVLARVRWPLLGDWYQLAVEHNGEMIGDVGVGRSSDGRQASIGYTLGPAHRGMGYATEAVGAIVDLLLKEGLHRITATVHPENIASARVLERLGFRYEGRAVSSAYVRGEWTDDDRYALLADERVAWLARNRQPPTTVDLVEITRESSRVVGRLQTHHSQEAFVATVGNSYADALLPELDPNGGVCVPWMRAIEADGEPVGFLMVADVTGTNPDPYLWRFLIDRHHQGRGVGRAALLALIDRYRAAGHSRLRTSWVSGRGSPEPFYLGLGFVPTGEIDDGEIVAALDLTSSA